MQNDWDAPTDGEDGEQQRQNGSSESPSSSIQDILSTLFNLQSSGGPRGGGRIIRLSGINVQDLSRLLNVRYPGNQNFTLDEEDVESDEEDEDDGYYNSFRAASRIPWKGPKTTEPQEAGLELLNSGDFGRVANKSRSRRKDANLATRIFDRAKKPQPIIYKEDYATDLVPNSNGTAISIHDANIYTGQYSADSSFYYTCSQDFRLHVFDTTAPLLSPGSRNRTGINLQTTMELRKSIQGHPGRWTITDANLSPDNERMIYSSITPTVYMTNVLDESQAQIPISFSDPSRSSHIRAYGEGFGIWSCRFSADGNEVVAGGSGKLFVYDLLANRRTVKIEAHGDDVNSCCWADTSSGNVLVSASDDTFIKIWDRRSLGASKKPSGVLVGHTEGITYVSAKGDGRYVISNGKDQAMRLWDLRKMRTSHEYDVMDKVDYGVRNFDYRYPPYPEPRYKAHPLDCSVMTYYGHTVMRTLIRCHFSPMETTGARYLYSGSADGQVHIWSLDGRVVQVLDCTKTSPMAVDPSEPERPSNRHRRSNVCVRDVSWHSREPVILSAGWHNDHSGSIVARHEWKGLLKMRGVLEDWAEKDRREQEDTSRVRRSRRLSERRAMQQLPGAFEDDEEE